MRRKRSVTDEFASSNEREEKAEPKLVSADMPIWTAIVRVNAIAWIEPVEQG
jgi:hypothetical protein